MSGPATHSLLQSPQFHEQPHSATMTFFQWVTVNLEGSSGSTCIMDRGKSFVGAQQGLGILSPVTIANQFDSISSFL